MYEGLPTATFATAATYDPKSPERGTWPTEYGAASQSSTLGEPLTADRWAPAWQSPLGPAGPPESLLVGAGTVVVNGGEARSIWHTNGEAVATMRRLAGTSFLDAKGARLLGDDAEAGFTTYTLHDGKRDARIMLAFPGGHTTAQIVEGPGALVILSLRDFPHGPPPEAIVEAVRVRDYANKSQHGILYGLEPLGGILRDADADVRMAAARTGPVLATPEGLRWCDWQLGTLHDVAFEGDPVALSVDRSDRAHLVFERDGVLRWAIVAPGASPSLDVELPWPCGTRVPPPIVTAAGVVVFSPPGHLHFMTLDGSTLGHERRSSNAPATISSNAILLVPQGDLLAITSDGDRYSLWNPPSPICTAPVLVGGVIYVATADTLFALRP